jgi:hypothetical protein
MSLLQPALLSGVCRHLSKGDLKALALCSSLWSVPAQCALYEEVTITDSTLPFVEALAGKPHLAECVRTFDVTISPTLLSPPSGHWVLAKAISHMVNLISLSLSIPGPQASTALPPHSHFPRMRTLKANFPIDPNVAQFLQAAPQLMTLHLYNLPEVSESAPTGNENLLEGTPLFLRYWDSLAVGRAASSFFTARELTPEVVRGVARASPSTRLTILDAETSSSLVQSLRAICSELPELEHLRLRTTFEFWGDVPSTVSTRCGHFLSQELIPLAASKFGGYPGGTRSLNVPSIR